MPAISTITTAGIQRGNKSWDDGRQILDYKMPDPQPHEDPNNAGAVLEYRCKVKHSLHWWGNKYKAPEKIKLHLKIKSYDDHLVENKFYGGRIYASDQTPHDETYIGGTSIGFLSWSVTIPRFTQWDAQLPDPQGGDAKWKISTFNPVEWIKGSAGDHQWYLVGQRYDIRDSHPYDDLDGKAKVEMKQRTWRWTWAGGLPIPGGTKTYERSIDTDVSSEMDGVEI